MGFLIPGRYHIYNFHREFIPFAVYLKVGFRNPPNFRAPTPWKRSDLWENPAMFISGSQAQELQCKKNGFDPNRQGFLSVLGYFTFTLTFVAGGNISQKLDVHINSSYKTRNMVIKKTHRTSLFFAVRYVIFSTKWAYVWCQISRPAGILYLEKTCGRIHRCHLPLCSFRVEAWRKHRDIMLMMTIFLN